jgi:serine/threonine protein kinase
VALKVLRPEVASATDEGRFRREIAILARLYHSHILQLFDAGVLEPGDGPAGLYYVMPYVRGESGRQRLRREAQFPIEDAVSIAAGVAEALGYALVSDFGIAGVLETAGGPRLSATGVLLGVPAYSSPEQARGDRHIDARSDIYSLGCVLYEMLGAEPPFTGATAGAVLARQIGDADDPAIAADGAVVAPRAHRRTMGRLDQPSRCSAVS